MANVTSTVATGKSVSVQKGSGSTKYAAGDTAVTSAREKAVLVAAGIVS